MDELDAIDCSMLKNLSSLETGNSSSRAITLSLPDSVQVLYLTGRVSVFRTNSIEKHLPKLIDYAHERIRGLTAKQLARSLQGAAGTLQLLDLNTVKRSGFINSILRQAAVPISDIDDPISSILSTLETLCREDCHVTDENLAFIAAHCPRLVHLSIAFNVDLANDGIIDFVQDSTGTLRNVDVRGCEHVSWEAVEKGGEMGVDVY